MSDKEVLSQEEKAVVETVLRFEAISLKHLASYVLQGNHRQTYDAVASLRKKKWLLVRDAPEDGREKYVVLAKRGVERCYRNYGMLPATALMQTGGGQKGYWRGQTFIFGCLTQGCRNTVSKDVSICWLGSSLKAAETVAIWGIEVDGKAVSCVSQKETSTQSNAKCYPARQ